jgi:polyisoprenoid-binding protein YceI
VVPGDSLLTILVYRAGPLAKAGHNHLIASRDLAGTLYVPADVAGTSFEVRIPVDGLTIDDAALRKQEGPDFSADVPDSAREGTRHNMLSDALLGAAQFPQIVVRSVRLEAAAGGTVTTHAEVVVRGAPHAVLFPAHYELQGERIVASGELPLKQSELGLTPFSAMLGALQVQDEMRVRFRIVARAGGG